ncbi:MAG TPA: peptidase domain-containing ABC transporter [Opitutaceae bacterium]|nr:peptidase domain-containing ABC transporter [Opitutaceae bacterium]
MKQRDQSDCGAACLAWIAAHHGLRLPLARIRQQAGTGRQGTTAAGLVEAAHALGFTAKGVKGPPDAIAGVPLPAIAHCLIDGRMLHYVVLVGWERGGARVMDPVVGRVERWTRARFVAAWTGILVLLAPGDGFRAGDHTQPAWRRLWQLLRPHGSVLAQAFAGAVVTTILGLGTAAYVQQIVDRVIPDSNRPLLNLLSVAMLVLLVGRLVLGVGQSLLSLRTAQRIDAALILAYYRHLLRLPQPFFDTMRVGEITSRVADAVKIRHFLNHTLLGLVLNPLILIFSLAAMFAWSWPLALLSLALVPLHAALYAAVNRLNRTHQRRLMERAADLDDQLVASLSSQRLLRAFRLEPDAELRTEARLVRLLRTARHAALAGLATGTAGTLLTGAYTVALLWIGGGLVLDARLTPGELMSCHALAGYLTGPIQTLLGLNSSVQEALVATDRLFEILDLELEPDQGLVDFTPAHAADIRFERVSFQPPGRASVLTDLSLTLPAGRLSVIAGDSGAGKTTLLALLQRLYAPTAGRILLGPHDLAYYRLGSLRRHLAVVPQNAGLLPGTVLENLVPGDYTPDLERLLTLCREAGILPLIESLPQGFFTPLPEQGALLSGGQRQRLALVRALYRDAPIVLLDEPTSALDARAEAETVALLLRERDRGRTVVVASHSPAFLAAADRIVTLGRAAPQ